MTLTATHLGSTEGALTLQSPWFRAGWLNRLPPQVALLGEGHCPEAGQRGWACGPGRAGSQALTPVGPGKERSGDSEAAIRESRGQMGPGFWADSHAPAPALPRPSRSGWKPPCNPSVQPIPPSYLSLSPSSPLSFLNGGCCPALTASFSKAGLLSVPELGFSRGHPRSQSQSLVEGGGGRGQAGWEPWLLKLPPPSREAHSGLLPPSLKNKQ